MNSNEKTITEMTTETIKKLSPKEKAELEKRKKREAEEAVYQEARRSRPMIKELADNWLKELTENDEQGSICLYDFQIEILANHKDNYNYEELYKQDWINDLVPWKRNGGRYYDNWDHGQKVEWHISEDIRSEKLKNLISWAKATTFNKWLDHIDYNLSDIDLKHFESSTARQLIRLGEKLNEEEKRRAEKAAYEKGKKAALEELNEKQPQKPTE